MSWGRLARRVGHGTRWVHSLPFGVERTADRLLPPGARLADGPGCPPDRGRPMSGCRPGTDRSGVTAGHRPGILTPDPSSTGDDGGALRPQPDDGSGSCLAWRVMVSA